jgi:hypothetical protein
MRSLTMDFSKEHAAELTANLRKERDQLRLKIHLGSMEAKEEWDELEKKWRHLESRLAHAKDEVAETSRGVSDSIGLIVDELGTAYGRIREGLRAM